MSGASVTGVLGNINTTLIKVMYETATIAQGTPHLPSVKGPGLKSLSKVYRATIGMLYAMYSPTTDMANMALIAAGPANARHPNRIEKITPKMTVLTGV